MTEEKEIERKEIQRAVSEYDPSKIRIGAFGSHSALPTGFAAKKAGLPAILFAKKGREKTYHKHNRKLYDEVVVLDEWKEMLSESYREKMESENVIFIPNRSFVVYLGVEKVERDFLVPLYGSRKLLRAEDRNAPPPRNQYHLLEKAGVRTPKLFENPDDIDKLSVVKVQQKDNPLERSYFYPSNPEEYYEISSEKIEAGEISEGGLEEAAIEEFTVGPMLNANFHFYAVPDGEDIDLVGFTDREQTSESGFRNLPADVQLRLADIGLRRTNEEICHRGKTLRESKLEMVYETAEKIHEALKREVPPGMIGPIGIQGALPIDEEARPEFVVFDLSFRVPGDPAMGPTSPYLRYLDIKHKPLYEEFMPLGWGIEDPLDLSMMEIRKAAHKEKLEEIVT